MAGFATSVCILTGVVIGGFLNKFKRTKLTLGTAVMVYIITVSSIIMVIIVIMTRTMSQNTKALKGRVAGKW